MYSVSRWIFCSLFLTTAVGNAAAQQLPLPGAPFIVAPRAPGSVIMMSSVSVSLPVDTAGDMHAQIEEAQESFYRMAGTQCDMVLKSLADDCQIVSVVSNADLNRALKIEVVRGTVSMSVKLRNHGPHGPAPLLPPHLPSTQRAAPAPSATLQL